MSVRPFIVSLSEVKEEERSIFSSWTGWTRNGLD